MRTMAGDIRAYKGDGGARFVLVFKSFD
jgi:hypothetical protein